LFAFFIKTFLKEKEKKESPYAAQALRLCQTVRMASLHVSGVKIVFTAQATSKAYERGLCVRFGKPSRPWA
jgi:hypothetical protein